MMRSTDVLIIGGGIAGMSLAARLAGRARVVLLEREELLAMHTTGRSAAVFTETYGNAAVRALTSESRPFFTNPPTGFADHPLLTPRATLFVARADHVGELNDWLAENPRASRAVPLEEVYDRMPILRRNLFAAAAEEFGAADIDVHGLFDGFRRMALHGGLEVVTAAEVHGIARIDDSWTVETGKGIFSARVIVNAAGAWAGRIGNMASLGDRGLMPLRRTAITIEPPEGFDVANWPFVCDVGDAFYFKPEGGLLLASPVDETPSEPCDAQPDEIDVATIAWRIEEITTMKVGRIRRKWAGLRTFTPDRTPIFEFDGAAPGFFWLAGQGGYGIQTAPSISLHAANKILHYLK
jgi:D-arginine dehydrogenase